MEIAQQARVWRELRGMLERQSAALDVFLGDWLDKPEHSVLLVGAGSSSFIGEVVADAANAERRAQVRAVSSTSLLTHPDLYLDPRRPTLLVSFARSGNSPESLAAVELVAARVERARFLNITCNEGGMLARQRPQSDSFMNLLMPPDSCDRGFAMTSSFSTMLLAAACVLDPRPWPQCLIQLEELSYSADRVLTLWSAPAAALALEPVDRVVYLGSGPLESLAKEAALKVLELTKGQIVALANTSLGFRHGPKSMLNAKTMVVMFRSRGDVAWRYEQDLLDELRGDGVAGHVLSVGPDYPGKTFDEDDRCWTVAVPNLPEAWLAPLWLLMAQQYALHKSVALGLTPDNPFPDGTVNRVVQGVTVYTHD